MEAEEVLLRLQGVFDDVFEGHGTKITPATTAGDIEEWDSLTHIELLVAIEAAFGIKFTAAEVGNLRNVGDLAAIIRTKTGG